MPNPALLFSYAAVGSTPAPAHTPTTTTTADSALFAKEYDYNLAYKDVFMADKKNMGEISSFIQEAEIISEMTEGDYKTHKQVILDKNIIEYLRDSLRRGANLRDVLQIIEQNSHNKGSKIFTKVLDKLIARGNLNKVSSSLLDKRIASRKDDGSVDDNKMITVREAMKDQETLLQYINDPDVKATLIAAANKKLQDPSIEHHLEYKEPEMGTGARVATLTSNVVAGKLLYAPVSKAVGHVAARQVAAAAAKEAITNATKTFLTNLPGATRVSPSAFKDGVNIAKNAAAKALVGTGKTLGNKTLEKIATKAAVKAAQQAGLQITGRVAARGLLLGASRVLGFLGGPVGITLSIVLPIVLPVIIDQVKKGFEYAEKEKASTGQGPSNLGEFIAWDMHKLGRAAGIL